MAISLRAPIPHIMESGRNCNPFNRTRLGEIEEWSAEVTRVYDVVKVEVSR